MGNQKDLLNDLEKFEEELVFDVFSSETALDIGMILIDMAKSANHKVAIDITKCDNQLFHYAFDGTSPDNAQWIIRKNRVVNRFYRSSLYIRTLLLEEKVGFEERFNLSLKEYAPAGGAFPIIIKGVGVVGTITVSGLTQEEDHEMAVGAIRNYLQSKLKK